MVVRDLDKAIEDWTKILRVLDPQSLEKRIVKYDEFSSGADAGMKWATFVNEFDRNPVHPARPRHADGPTAR
jgi:methylmalonyl-CoA/ethylmalonyl-CoA epimerase